MTLEVKGKNLDSYVLDCRKNYEKHLKEMVDIPSVSADPAHKEDIIACGKKAVEIIKEMGGKAELIETKGNPVVVGEFHAGENYPTVTIYNHIDVQPADAAEWDSEPFKMRIEGDKYLGRGSTDDKGPALSVLYAAKFARENAIGLNIKFIWELEEEIGSPSFEAFLKENLAKLKTDFLAVSDTIWISRERPAIGYGLRGLQGVIVKLKTGTKDVHSGLTGGLARNPIGELADLIAKCYDAKSGEVKIPGFYDDVNEFSEEEGNDFVKSGFNVENFRKAHELLTLRSSDNLDGAKRIWALPTFEVHGITGGYSGPGVKTIVPYHAEAKISMRLVASQKPEKILKLFEDFVKKECPDAQVEREGSLYPYVGDKESPEAKAAAKAMKEAFGVEPAFVREGGSIGAIVSMKNVLGKDSMLMGLSLPEHGYHAINENFDWQQASGGIKMFVAYFKALSELKS
ncbi:MAG: M20/M25/M40 family metallo-hydrolase [Candidatus Obscuribacterales bacterium]|nr:M20/M25/M40 family metallo-hydrolase [Candidatus Obscuribacterales bacterium]